MRNIALWLALFVFVATSPAAARTLTILVSIDGFRSDYLDRGVTPTLSGLAASGVRAAMRPSFPSKTFPNHYTLITGLRPDRHGIVDNNMEDPRIPGVTFKMSNQAAVVDRRWWDGGEPLWVTAERAQVRTGTMFWPGSEADVHGIRPSLWLHFDPSRTSAQRVDQVLAWLDLPPGERPQFVTLYFDEVDTAGHFFGPDSKELNQAAGRVDTALGRLVEGLKARGDIANLVIVADHGMASVSEDRRIFLEDLMPTEAAPVRVLASGAFMTIYPGAGHERQAERALVGRHSRLECWKKGHFPSRFHYGRNPRAAPIFCLPQTGWMIFNRGQGDREKGAHGFDPASPEMAAVFVASGPAFRHGVRLATFDNVDVYPLLARLIEVAPQPNDGHLAPFRAALAH